MDWQRSRRRPLLRCLFFSLFVLLSIVGARTVCLDLVSPSDCLLQEGEKTIEKKEQQEEEAQNFRTRRTRKGFGIGTMRHLSGLGSFPPRCTSKCGKCTPCKPVHVPVPPGTSAPTEYYPEAWRCKCGNKLYMP